MKFNPMIKKSRSYVLITIVVLVVGGYSISQNTKTYEDATVGKLVDARNNFVNGKARGLVLEVVDAIMYIKELDKELADYGVTISDNAYLFVEIDGVNYKIGLDKIK